MDVKQVGALISGARQATREVDRQLGAIGQLELIGDPEHYDEEKRGADERLTLLVARAVRRLRIVYEVIPLPSLMTEFDAALTACPSDKPIDYFAHDTDYPFSPMTELVKERLADLEPLVSNTSPVRAERRLAARIVDQIAHLMARRGIVPSKEHDVQGELYFALLAAFPDVIREPSVPQPTKVYKPDFGISSIGMAIEAKYLDDPKHVGTILGGIYEDMKGYAGSEWDVFLAVIYQTGAHVSQAVLDAEAQKVGTPKSWRITLVTGAGAPKPVKPAKPVKPPSTNKGRAPGKMPNSGGTASR
jgi:hypothetical protein